MAMAWIWTGMAVVSVVCGAVYGRMETVSAAALEGAGQAVRLCLSMAGVLCLWTGLMEVMDRCGLSRRLGRLFRPVLRRLLPQASRDPETLAAVTANVSANLLGLGNAATPMGIRAACRMARGTEGVTRMAMAWIWTGMAVVSVVCGAVYGRMETVSAAALEGAGQAVRLCLSMAGVLCLWTGLMEVMDRCGLSRRLGRLFRPVLRRLLPQASRDPETLAAVTANVSANLLGLGNAATPMGIRAACRMARGTEGVASDELCRLVVLNTASIQLLPTTVASIRAVCGSAAPLDILPAVWVSSLLSVTAGLAAAKLLERLGRRRT